MTVNTETLLQLGFIDFASWHQDEDPGTISYRIENHANRNLAQCRNALYAFARDQEVMYIGKTTRSMEKRFIGYCKPGKQQATNRRCHENIKSALKADEEIRIFLFVPVSLLQYGDFEINLAAGLEDSLIKEFAPAWNGNRGQPPVSEESQREVEEEKEISQSGPPSDMLTTMSAEDGPSFEIKLGDTCYNKGTINPGKRMNRYLGEDGASVVIYLGTKDDAVASKISRTANRSGAVRIVGNNWEIARWFQNNFGLWDVVDAKVLGRGEILLLPPQSMKTGI
jgi:hypothetical protein